ncbi:hypothetical protein SPI_07923 [Niveomyces insectorum RCEF 264]|uniref:DUF8021 domain-containing protein n=1 Tax=Niveomyces insectorum RCEF 264 TaxID=1081102 RepID=A0A167P5I0_9HYPO|nr:hypothetical protein SPI_07923 [Niveomyces insectorum RCEF 264]
MLRHSFVAAWTVLALAGPVAAAATETATATATRSCDRACLEGVLDNYLAALAAHNTSRLPTTPDVLYVENDQILPLGTGAWRTAGSPGRYRHVFADPPRGQVGAITTLTENGVRIIYVVRLGVDLAPGANKNTNNDNINTRTSAADAGTNTSLPLVREIETQLTRDPVGAALYENMTRPEAVWLTDVAPAQRLPRATLVHVANQYYSGMERNDPHGNYSFFDRDCNRLEDAVQTTNQRTGAAYGHSNDTVFASLGCAAQFQTGFLGFVTRIRARRFPVVDEARQAVLAMTTLDHNGTVRVLPDVNGVLAPIPPYFDVPRSLQAAEAFRLRTDKLYRIEMTLTEVPYRMRSPFLAADDVRYVPSNNASTKGVNGSASASAAAPPTPFPQPCDRACLRAVTDRVLHAMLAHDAASLPLGAGAQYSENGQFLEWDNGLWETLQEVTWPGYATTKEKTVAARSTGATNGTSFNTAYGAVALADPTTRTAGYWGLSREQTTPGVLALRIQLDVAGRITTVEAVDVRAESTGARGGTMTLMRPPLPVEWQGNPIAPLDAAFTVAANAPNAPNATIPSTLLDTYLTGWANHDSTGVPFAPGCVRRDNGQQQNQTCADQLRGRGPAPNGLFQRTTAVRDRRVLAADAQQGLVMAVAMVDNPAIARNTTATLPPTERVPGTYMVPQLLKVDSAGRIARVEGMVKWMPYGYTSAWAADRVTG